MACEMRRKLTRCHVGHDLTPANVRVEPKTGRRHCLACGRRHARERYHRLAEQRLSAHNQQQRPRKERRPNKPRHRSESGTVAAAVWCETGRERPNRPLSRFNDVAEAERQANRERCDNPDCASLHILVWRVAEHRCGVKILPAKPPPPLADELAALYPRSDDVVGHQVWALPRPVVLNEELPPRDVTRRSPFKN